MMYYHRSITKTGEIQAGSIDASSIDDALIALSSRDLIVVELNQGNRGWWERLNEQRGSAHSVDRRDVQSLLSDLGQLVAAGIRLEQALKLANDLAEKPATKTLTETILTDLRKGMGLGDAFSKHTNVFPPHIVAAVRAGEKTGRIEDTFTSLTRSESLILEFRDKMISSLIYPTILLFMVTVAFAIVLFVVLPEFAPLFESTENLPTLTKIVLALSHHSDALGQTAFAFFAICTATVLLALNNEEIKASLDEWIIKTPRMQAWVAAPDLIRACQILGSSLQAGVKIDHALLLSSDSIGNSCLKKLFLDGAAAVRRGQSLADFWDQKKILPGVLVNFLRIGEQAGTFGSMCLTASHHLTRAYQKRLDRLLALFPPLVTLVLGGSVAVLIGGVLLGMISLNNVALK